MKIWKEAFDDKIFEKSLIIYVDDVVWNNVVTQFALRKLPNYKRKVINGADLSQAWFFEQNQNLSLFSEKTLWG